MVVLLVVAILSGIIALFMRGFKVTDLTNPPEQVTTPAVQVWAVQIEGYTEKMATYKDAVAYSNDGYGVHVFRQGNSWVWVAGIYDTQEQASAVIDTGNLPEQATSKLLTITKKHFKIDSEASVICNKILSKLQDTTAQLQALREAVLDNSNYQDCILSITSNLSELKSSVTTLQDCNAKLQSQFVAALIYAANQNIIVLNDVVLCNASGKQFLALVNTALIKNIFSLDNF